MYPEEKKSSEQTEAPTKNAESANTTEGAVTISVSPSVMASPSKVAHLRNVAQGVTETEIASKCQVWQYISIFC